MTERNVWLDDECPVCRHGAVKQELGRSIGRTGLAVHRHAAEDGHVASGTASPAILWHDMSGLCPFGLMACHPVVMSGLDQLHSEGPRPKLRRVAARFAPEWTVA